MKNRPPLARAWIVAIIVLALAGCAGAPEARQLAVEYYNVGNAYFEMGQYQKALDMYRRALSYSPGFLEVSYSAARAHVALGDYDEGIRNLRQLAAADRGNVLVLTTLGYAYAKKGDLAGAADAYTRAVGISPGNLNGWHNLALVRIAGGDFAGAEDGLRRAYALDPANTQVLGDLARVLGEQGKKGEAIQFYELLRAGGGGPANPAASRKLAWLYFDEKYYAKALGLLDELLKGGDVQAGDYFLKARLHLIASRELEAGLAALDQALEKKYADTKKIAELLAEVPTDYQESVRKLLEKRNVQLESTGR